MRYLTEDLIASAKRRCMVPTSQNTFSDADLIAIANEEMETNLTPLIISVRENYYLTYNRTTLTASKSRYPTPPRAMGNALKDLWLVDSSGNRINTVIRTDVNQLPTGGGTSTSPSEILLYGDEIMLVPTPGTGVTGSIEQWYFARPNELVATTSCTKITAVSTVGSTTTFTVNTDLTASLAVGGKIDIASGVSPFLLWAEDATITAITATTIAVAKSDVTDEAGAVEPVVSDYICPAKKTNIPMAPEEFHPILAQMVSIVLLESIGDLNKVQVAEARLDKMKSRALKLIANRIESGVERIFNPSSILSAIGTAGTSFIRT